MKMAVIKSAVSGKLAKAGMALSKASPEIWLGVGVVGIGVGVVLACKATLKCDELLDDVQNDFDRIRDAREERDEEDYSSFDHARDLTITYIRSGWKVVKLYAPAAIALGLGVGCILNSHHILRMRYGALASAYTALDQAYQNYRSGVVDRYGEDVDKELAKGRNRVLLDEAGNVVQGEEWSKDKSGDPYAVLWDALNRNWDNDPANVYYFLSRVQQLMTEKLHDRGHLFLNEVYDALGIDRTEIGQFAGWVMGNGDECVDFGLPGDRQTFFKLYTDSYGYCCPVELMFNCDGKIIQFLSSHKAKHNK